jgi:hypothetical protein
MKFSLLAILLLFSPTAVFACKCVPPPPNINTPRAIAEWHFQHASAVFSGKVESLELKGWPIHPEPGKTVSLEPVIVATFSHVYSYRGDPKNQFVVRTGLGGGDCGFPFKLGEAYLVDAQVDDSGNLHTVICSGSTNLKSAETETRFLRGQPPTTQDLTDLNVFNSHTDPLPSPVQLCGQITFPPGVTSRSVFLHAWLENDPRPFPSDETDSQPDGSFCFTDLEPGQYLIDALEAEPEDEDFRYVSYFPGAANPKEAKAVNFTKSADMKADFVMQRQPLFTVSGTLQGFPHPKGQTIQVMLLPGHLMELQTPEPASLVADGKFAIRKVPPGRYQLFASTENSGGSITFLSSVLTLNIDRNFQDLKLRYIAPK